MTNKGNGASMVKVAQLSGLDHIGCFIHTIQLVVNHGLKTQRGVYNAIATACTLVGHFSYSTKATQQLQEIQKSLHSDGSSYPTHRLISDVVFQGGIPHFKFWRDCWNRNVP